MVSGICPYFLPLCMRGQLDIRSHPCYPMATTLVYTISLGDNTYASNHGNILVHGTYVTSTPIYVNFMCYMVPFSTCVIIH